MGYDYRVSEAEAEAAVATVIRYITDTKTTDPLPDGMQETPIRVLRSWLELFAGYGFEPEAVFKTFDVASDEMVLVKDIAFTSHCEHHMLPFTGKAHVAYLPAGKVVGLSKLARLVDGFARRFQVQERLTNQVVDALMTHLKPKGAACVVEATHGCMGCRGVRQPHAVTVTSALRGAFKEDPKTRAEFMAFVNAR